MRKNKRYNEGRFDKDNRRLPQRRAHGIYTHVVAPTANILARVASRAKLYLHASRSLS